MDIAGRLERVEQEIGEVENEKLQREQILHAFLEHMPPVDPILIEERISLLQRQISFLEERKRVLLKEQQALIVRAVTLGDRGDNEKVVTVSSVCLLSSYFIFRLSTGFSKL